MKDSTRALLADILTTRNDIATGPILDAMDRVDAALSSAELDPSDEFFEYIGTLAAWLAGSAGAMITHPALKKMLGNELIMNVLAVVNLIVLLDVYRIARNDVSLDGIAKEDMDWLNSVASRLGNNNIIQ